MILKEETYLYSKADLYRKDYEIWSMHKEIVPQSVKTYTTFEVAFKKKTRMAPVLKFDGNAFYFPVSRAKTTYLSY